MIIILLFISLYLTINFSFLGSLSNNNGNVNKNNKKEIGLDWQNNNFECASHFFEHFFAVTAQLGCKNAQFHDLSGMGTQDNNFPFLFLNFDISLQGCALAEPGGPRHITFALRRLENLRFFIQIICWAP